MRTKWVVTQLIWLANLLGLLSIQAINEGMRQFCGSFGPNMPRHYLDFEYWGTVGWFLGVVAAGLFIGAVKFGVESNEFEPFTSENAKATDSSPERDR